MKIDTSKLTPVQAQQIEAIASGVPFVTQTPRTTRSFFRGVSIELKTTTRDDEFDAMLSELENVSTPTKPSLAVKRDAYVATLKKEAQGIPVWHCRHTIQADDFNSLMSALFMNNDAQERLVNEVSHALVSAYGPTMKFDDTMGIFGLRITAEFEAWKDVHQWYLAHTALDTDSYDDIQRTVNEVVERFTAGLGIFDRLRARYSGYRDRSVWARIVRWFIVDIPVEYRHRVRILKAALSKTLDILRPKA